MEINTMSFEDFTDTCGYIAAVFAAGDWYDGQWSGLYMLSCNRWQFWRASDILRMIDEFEEQEETREYADTMREALTLFIADYGDVEE